MKESDLQRLVQIAATKLGARLFRNNTAMAWAGKIIYTRNDTITLQESYPIHAGLCKGSSDLIGWTAYGQFLAIELKSETGRATPEQEQFIAAVKKTGGRAGIARSVAEAENIILGDIDV